MKKCKYCGKPAEIIDVSKYGYESGYTVACSSAHCPVYPITKKHKTEEAAVSEWDSIQKNWKETDGYVDYTTCLA